MNRRRFLRAFSTTAAGLLLAPGALETIAEFSHLLRDVYEPVVRAQLNACSSMVQALGVSEDVLRGERFTFATDLQHKVGVYGG